MVGPRFEYYLSVKIYRLVKASVMQWVGAQREGPQWPKLPSEGDDRSIDATYYHEGG